MQTACQKVNTLDYLAESALSQVLHDFVFSARGRCYYLVLRQHVLSVLTNLNFFFSLFGSVWLINVVQTTSVVFYLI